MKSRMLCLLWVMLLSLLAGAAPRGVRVTAAYPFDPLPRGASVPQVSPSGRFLTFQLSGSSSQLPVLCLYDMRTRDRFVRLNAVDEVTFLPDESRMLFWRRPGRSTQGQFGALSLPGGNEVRAYPDNRQVARLLRGAYLHGFSYLTRTREIVFSCSRDYASGTLYAISTGTGYLRKLMPGDRKKSLTDPVCSPDGNTIAFDINANTMKGLKRKQVWLMRSDGKRRHFLMPGEIVGWLPDSRRLIVVVRTHTGARWTTRVMSVGTAGGARTELYRDDQFVAPRMSPSRRWLLCLGYTSPITLVNTATGEIRICALPPGWQAKHPLQVYWGQTDDALLIYYEERWYKLALAWEA